MKFRYYNKNIDRKSCHRIWKENAWIEGKDEQKAMDIFVSDGRNLVAEVNDNAEGIACGKPGNMNYQGNKLKFSAIVAVATSRIARKQGLEASLTAQLIAEKTIAGAHVCGLGIYESGFYDQLGFGLGRQEIIRYFDPSKLKISSEHRTPIRLGKKDFNRIYQSLASRYRSHGSIMIDSENYFQAEMKWSGLSFGLGYSNKFSNEISHFIWIKSAGDNGPYRIAYMAWQNKQQLLELLSLIHSLSDQVSSVGMVEHPEIQLDQLLEHPVRLNQLTHNTDIATGRDALSYWQARICNLEACISACKIDCLPIEFNLKLSDPIAKYLDKQTAWQGLAGEYSVYLGADSKIQPELRKGLPLLTTDVNAFTRLWLGVQTARGLSITDNFSAPEELILGLDECFRLPQPSFNLDF